MRRVAHSKPRKTVFCPSRCLGRELHKRLCCCALGPWAFWTFDWMCSVSVVLWVQATVEVCFVMTHFLSKLSREQKITANSTMFFRKSCVNRKCRLVKCGGAGTVSLRTVVRVCDGDFRQGESDALKALGWERDAVPGGALSACRSDQQAEGHDKGTGQSVRGTVRRGQSDKREC